MKLYFAPLEGITTYTYRKTHKEMFGECTAYYSPFINPSENEKISMKNLRDIIPENNGETPIVVQALTNNATSFLKFADSVKALGYDEININLGCPSGTVFHKGRGAGFLANPQGIDDFLYEIFSKTDLKISLKTRIGVSEPEELDRLMEIYNKYPLSLLIIHPRTRKDFYNGIPDIEAFERAYKISRNKVCYNGDILTVEDFEKIVEKFPGLDSVMIGRGAIANPGIFREIQGGAKISVLALKEFSQKLIEKYLILLKSDKFTLQKMKEIWMYVMWRFPEEKKVLKAIKKSNTLSDFNSAIKLL